MALAKTSARDRLNSELHHLVSLTSAFFENWGGGDGSPLTRISANGMVVNMKNFEPFTLKGLQRHQSIV